MRLLAVAVLIALLGLAAQPAVASHTVKEDRDGRVGDDVYVTRFIDISTLTMEPPGVLEVVLPPPADNAVRFRCLRPGQAIARYRYVEHGVVHSVEIKFTCRSVKQDD